MNEDCFPAYVGGPNLLARSDDRSTAVLDRLAVPAAPLINAGDDRAGLAPLTADPIAVPTPTAGEFGLAVALGVLVVQAIRRARRRPGAGAR